MQKQHFRSVYRRAGDTFVRYCPKNLFRSANIRFFHCSMPQERLGRSNNSGSFTNFCIGTPSNFMRKSTTFADFLMNFIPPVESQIFSVYVKWPLAKFGIQSLFCLKDDL